jgi:hypothetical protein
MNDGVNPDSKHRGPNCLGSKHPGPKPFLLIRSTYFDRLYDMSWFVSVSPICIDEKSLNKVDSP